MRSRIARTRVLMALVRGIVAATASVAVAAGAEPAVTRTWEMSYRATVTDIPAGTRSLRIWLPLPREDEHQTITDLEIHAPLAQRRVIDPEYGNRLIRFEAVDDIADTVAITVTFVVERGEGTPVLPRETGPAFNAQLARFLAPDSLVPVTGVIGELARSVTDGISDDRLRAEAIYAYVLRTMRYDKSGTGWGRGDAIFACNERRGNCTDIHSLLIGMARASGIPARFVMGFPVPAGEAGEIAGYHCWADLYLEGSGWVPVDASEAIKHPALSESYFGRLDPNRVAFTIGRDIHLEQDADAPRVNYFIYPRVELGGTEDAATVSWEVSYRARPPSGD